MFAYMPSEMCSNEERVTLIRTRCDIGKRSYLNEPLWAMLLVAYVSH